MNAFWKEIEVNKSLKKAKFYLRPDKGNSNEADEMIKAAYGEEVFQVPHDWKISTFDEQLDLLWEETLKFFKDSDKEPYDW